MANNTPRGLVPIKMPLVSGVEYLNVSSALSSDIGMGTPVVQTAAGYVEPLDVATVSGQTFVGVSMDFYDASAEGARTIAVCTDPNQKFLIQSSVTSNTIALVGASIGIANPSSVNSTTGLSSATAAGAGTTASAPLRVVGKHDREGNDWGAYVDLIVQPIHGLHQRAGAAGI